MVHQIHKLLEQLKLIPGQNMEVQRLLLFFIGCNSMHLVWFPCISCMEFRPPSSDFHTLAWKSDSSIPAWCGSECLPLQQENKSWVKLVHQRFGLPALTSFILEATRSSGRFFLVFGVTNQDLVPQEPPALPDGGEPAAGVQVPRGLGSSHAALRWVHWHQRWPPRVPGMVDLDFLPIAMCKRQICMLVDC